jgi:hypothetical protein
MASTPATAALMASSTDPTFHKMHEKHQSTELALVSSLEWQAKKQRASLREHSTPVIKEDFYLT